MRKSFYANIFKPTGDYLVACLLVFITFPMALFIFLVRFSQIQKQVFFFQERSGLNQVPFTLIKFRTLDDQGHADSGFSQFLRKSGLDEWPQLLNILRGDMSLVGPRPLLPKYDGLYSITQKQRFLRKPGITGLAQVHDEHLSSWEEKLQLDVEYVSDCSFLLDLKIFFLTTLKAVRFRASKSKGSISELEWKGSSSTS